MIYLKFLTYFFNNLIHFMSEFAKLVLIILITFIVISRILIDLSNSLPN